jgi:hypothetical protein
MRIFPDLKILKEITLLYHTTLLKETFMSRIDPFKCAAIGALQNSP